VSYLHHQQRSSPARAAIAVIIKAPTFLLLLRVLLLTSFLQPTADRHLVKD
jgi:hypothetical protein